MFFLVGWRLEKKISILCKIKTPWLKSIVTVIGPYWLRTHEIQEVLKSASLMKAMLCENSFKRFCFLAFFELLKQNREFWFSFRGSSFGHLHSGWTRTVFPRLFPNSSSISTFTNGIVKTRTSWTHPENWASPFLFRQKSLYLKFAIKLKKNKKNLQSLFRLRNSMI